MSFVNCQRPEINLARNDFDRDFVVDWKIIGLQDLVIRRFSIWDSIDPTQQWHDHLILSQRTTTADPTTFLDARLRTHFVLSTWKLSSNSVFGFEQLLDLEMQHAIVARTCAQLKGEVIHAQVTFVERFGFIYSAGPA